MPTVTLDANTVRTATCPSGQKKLDLYDTTIPGFVLEVRPSGGKTYYLRYRDAHGKQKQLRIGDAAGISFEQAKAAVLTTRAKVILGDDPVQEKRTLRTIPTLEEFAHERYLPYVKGAKRSWDTDESFLRNHVLPRWGRLHLDEVKQQDVIEFHHALKAKGYEVLFFTDAVDEWVAQALPEFEQEPGLEEVADASEHGGQWNSDAQRVCIIVPMNTIQTSVSGMNTFQPSRMIWS